MRTSRPAAFPSMGQEYPRLVSSCTSDISIRLRAVVAFSLPSVPSIADQATHVKPASCGFWFPFQLRRNSPIEFSGSITGITMECIQRGKIRCLFIKARFLRLSFVNYARLGRHGNLRTNYNIGFSSHAQISRSRSTYFASFFTFGPKSFSCVSHSESHEFAHAHVRFCHRVMIGANLRNPRVHLPP